MRQKRAEQSSKFFLYSPCGWRALAPPAAVLAPELISIHALRVEGDRPPFPLRLRRCISIHALRVEGDRAGTFTASISRYFYPRPPGGGRQQRRRILTAFFHFYPRPPGGGRLVKKVAPNARLRFLSTPSGWRATRRADDRAAGGRISIHALRVEGVDRGLRFPSIPFYFYPRPPGGGRPAGVLPSGSVLCLLSSPSVWRATLRLGRCCSHPRISIHALRVVVDIATQ